MCQSKSYNSVQVIQIICYLVKQTMEVKSRTQGSRPRPRTKKFRGQGQGHKKISRPRQKTDPLKAKDQGHRRKRSPKKKVKKNIFQAISKKGLQKFFSSDFHLRKTKIGLRKFSARFLALSNKISTVQKIVLSSSRGQGNFRGLEASRPRPRTSKSVLEDVLEAEDVLEDSTSDGDKSGSNIYRFSYLL